MSIKATSSGGLAIAVAAAKSNKTLAASAFTATTVDVADAWNNGATNVAPTSTHNGEDWYTAQAANADEWENKDAAFAYAAEGAISSADKLGAGYFYHTQVYVKTLNQNAVRANTTVTPAVTANPAKLYVQSLTIDLGDEANDLEKALRVAFVCGDNVVVFAPYQASNYVGTHVQALTGQTATAANSTYSGFVVGTTGSSTTAFLGDLFYGDAAGNYAQVDMFVYYEGQDEYCMTINAVNLDDVTVDVTFGSTVPTASN
jgi:hypothetical protein